MKHDTIILKCFIQFTCTNLDGFKKEGVNFLICFRERGYPERGGGYPQKGEGGLNPGYFSIKNEWASKGSTRKTEVEVIIDTPHLEIIVVG